MPLPSCVDGPWRARVFSRSGQGGTCGHVSGLYARYKTAGPDGDRGSSSDHRHEVALPQGGRQVCLDLSVDRQCHHACSPSQAFRLCRAWPLRPIILSAGSTLGRPTAAETKAFGSIYYAALLSGRDPDAAVRKARYTAGTLMKQFGMTRPEAVAEIARFAIWRSGRLCGG